MKLLNAKFILYSLFDLKEYKTKNPNLSIGIFYM